MTQSRQSEVLLIDSIDSQELRSQPLIYGIVFSLQGQVYAA